MSPTIRVVAVVFAVVFTGFAWAQQPNTANASAVWQGIDGPPWPIALSLGNDSTASLQVTGAPLQPYALAWAPSGLSPGLIATGFGIVDLNLPGGVVLLLDGFNGTSFYDLFAFTNAAGSATLALSIPAGLSAPLGGFQALVGDPGAAAGYTLSAATAITFGALDYYVSPSGNSGNPGTAAAPVDTISAAIALWQAHQPAASVHFHVAAGTYSDTPTLPPVNGLTVTGGCHPTTWVPQPGVRSVFTLGSDPMRFNAISAGVVSSIEFDAPSGTMGIGTNANNSVGVFVWNSPSLRFSSCAFMTANAGDGFSPPDSAAGAPGINGGPGGNAGPAGAAGIGAAGAGGGNGEDGGAGTTGAGNPGYPGLGPAAAGAGGTGGVGCGSGGPGGPGQTLPPGAVLAGGTSGTPLQAPTCVSLQATTFIWLQIPNGGLGGSGTNAGWGGGGGGAGGGHGPGPFCLPVVGAGGGGGGGGGGKGLAGGGGFNGGSSVGVVVSNCATSGVSTVEFQDCVFVIGNAGHGGDGGNGGAGGPGGVGGPGGLPGATNGGPGGAGGNGQPGLNAGGGGGGAGGTTCGIRAASSALVNVVLLGANQFTIGTPGAGGSGGLNGVGGVSGANGPTGQTGNVVQ